MIRARLVALDTLGKIRREESFANLVVPGAIADARLDSRDAALVTDLVYGTLRLTGFLDAILEKCASGGIDRLEPNVRDILRLAGYDLIERVAPAHVVSEWVDVASRRVPRARGLVNAVLRRVSERNRAEWSDAVVTEMNESDRDAVLFSHPGWIVDEYRSILGVDETRELLRANNVPAVPTLVALPGLASVPDGAERTRMSPIGFRAQRGNPANDPDVRRGLVRVQDEGSQLAALLLAHAAPIAVGERWLDLCAGPGGKTALLAGFAVPADATLEANEFHAHRAELVRRALAAWGDAVPVYERDGREFASTHPATYDRILVDVPCTGLGALRRRPEARWRKSPNDIAELVPLQHELLDAAIQATRVGGTIAYVTCSPLTAETTLVVDAVTTRRGDVELIDTTAVLRRIAPGASLVERGTAVQLWPHRHETDAMFIQLLRRTR